MDGGAANLIAQSDHQHLAQAALQRTDKIRMQLDPIDRNDQICVQRRFVEKQRHAAAQRPDLPAPDLADNGNAHCFFGNAVSGKDGTLTLGRPAAMAPHCRNDKRLCSLLFQRIRRSAHDHSDVCDAPAADRQCNAHAGTQPLADFDAPQLFHHSAAHVPDVCFVKALPNTDHRRKRIT